MEISFETKLLRDICEQPNAANRVLGGSVTTDLFARLADIDAVDSLADLRSLGILSQDGDPQTFFIELNGGCRLLFSPVQANGTLPGNKLDEIDRIKINAIGVVK